MSGVGLVTVSERMSMSGKMDSVEVVVEEPYPVEDVDRQFVCKEDGSFAMCLNLDKRCNMMDWVLIVVELIGCVRFFKS